MARVDTFQFEEEFPIEEIVPILVADENLKSNYLALVDYCQPIHSELLRANSFYSANKYNVLIWTILHFWRDKCRKDDQLKPTRALIQWLNGNEYKKTAEILRTKLKLPSPSKQGKPTSRPSEIDNTRLVKVGHAVISLVRYSNKTNHIFLVCEYFAEEDWTPELIFVDFVADRDDQIWIPNKNPGVVRIKGAYSNAPGKTGELKYKLNNVNIMGIQKGQDAFVLDMPMENFRLMLKNIRADQAKPPIFCIFGNDSLSTVSLASSFGNEHGHSCFTFAKSHIVRAYEEAARIFRTNPAKYVISIPGDSLFGEHKLVTYIAGIFAACYFAYFYTNYSIIIDRA